MKYKCTICKYEYDPAQGDPTQGIAPGTPFEALPADWKCPRCKQGKEKFEPIEEPKPANPYAGTQTEKNLHAAFAGESEARNKYTYFASKAKKEGFEQIAALFLQTATKALLVPPRPRASPSWPLSSVVWPPSRSTTKSVTAPCCTTSRPKKSLPRAK